jgi:cytochrome P450
MEPFIREVATKLVDGFLSSGQAEILSQFAYLLPLEVIFSILGIPQQDLAMVKKRSDELRMMLSLPLSMEQQVEYARQYVALQHYYAHLIEERRQHPGSDLISDLVRDGMAGDDPLSDADLINQITGVVIAGHETTAHLIGSGLFLLLEEPTRWQALCEHPEHIPLVIEEILRLRGPALGFTRTTTREVTVGGIIMPEGTRLLLLYASGSTERVTTYLPRTLGQGQAQSLRLCMGLPLSYFDDSGATYAIQWAYTPNFSRTVPNCVTRTCPVNRSCISPRFTC